jgi:S-formylglutathione hydrolase FrmB
VEGCLVAAEAASEHEVTTAYFGDQQPMAEALEREGVPAEVVFSTSGHGYAYWGQVREAAIAFLQAHDVEGG